jgi:molybdopterin-binding protein
LEKQAVPLRNHLRSALHVDDEDSRFVDTIVSHVVVHVGDRIIESIITGRSADELALAKGDRDSVTVTTRSIRESSSSR